MFTLDSTTLFWYNLSNATHASQTTKQQVIEEWARGIPPNASHYTLARPPSPNSSRRINGAEAELARRNYLVQVIMDKKFELAKELEMKNHPLLGSKELQPIAIPTTFVWAAAQIDPWNLWGDKAIRRAFQKIADSVWLAGSRYIDDLYIAYVTQRISDTWRASIGSAAVMIVHSFFELQPEFKDSDEARQEYSQMQLRGDGFLYGRGASGSVKMGIFRGPLVIMTFAQHLIATNGAIPLNLYYEKYPYGALVLAFVAVKRAFTLWAHKWITIKDARQAENTGNPIRFPNLVNDKTGVDPNTYVQFSKAIWGRDTNILMGLALTLTDDDFNVIITEAQNFIKTRYGGNSESMTSPPDYVLSMEVSDDSAKDQWFTDLFPTYSPSSHADPCPYDTSAVYKKEPASHCNIMPLHAGARHDERRYPETPCGEDTPNREESFRHLHEEPSRRRTREESNIGDHGSSSRRRRRRIK